MGVIEASKERYYGKGGYKDILTMGLPLMGSMLSITFMEFTDKLLLGHYSIPAVAAVGPASIAHLLFLVTFTNIIGFIGIIIAQYVGAEKPTAVGKILWQGVWIGLICSAVLFLLGIVSEDMFIYTNQPIHLIPLEMEYFNTLAYLSIVPLMNAVFIAFFSGRGKTGIISIAITVAAVVNIPLNYLLINGLWIFPEMGIRGAAMATIIAWFVELCILLFGTFTKKNNIEYGITSGFSLDISLIRRTLRYGVPSGLYNFLELLGATVFLFLVGSLGQVELATINVAFSLDLFGYLPIVGLSIALSMIVGRSIGEKNLKIAQRAFVNSVHLAFALRIFISILFIAIPFALFRLIIPQDISAEASAIVAYAPSMLGIAVLNGFIDAIMLMYIGLLKGVGDTVYIMWGMFLSVIIGLIIPSVLFFMYGIATMYTLWTIFIAYKVCAVAIFYTRYKTGKWEKTAALH